MEISKYQLYHRNLPERIRKWLNNRGISDEIIDHHFIGWNEPAITIPIFDINGQFLFFKYRIDPEKENQGNLKYWHDEGAEATLYGLENIKNKCSPLIICEGELDRLTLESKGFSAIASTAGAGTFKEEWTELFKNIPEIYICFDNDEAGRKGAEKVAKLIPWAKVIMLPEMGEDKKDITDYFKIGKSPNDFRELMKKAKNLNEFEKEAEEIEFRIKRSVESFPPITIGELYEILGLTIKRDNVNKLITSLCMISAYTEGSQFNISYNAPSSTGKSYIPLEIDQLFPPEDVKEIGYSSPTAFYHDTGNWIKELQGYKVDLERKILIFIDQPHPILLQRLRPLLSHDRKEIICKITDKKKKYGLKTKNVYIKGFPSVIFCTGSLKIDEQEATRMILLSPEISQEKFREAIYERIKRECDQEKYNLWLESDERRKLLKERIKAIKDAEIRYIIIPNQEEIFRKFLSRYKILKPRYSRDISRLLSITKALALLNFWHRGFKGRDIIANEEDIKEAFNIWDEIAETQELGIPPYVYQLYQNVILSLWKEKEIDCLGLTKEEILRKHYEIYQIVLPEWRLRQEIIPMMENGGLIELIPDPEDKRKTLIRPILK